MWVQSVGQKEPLEKGMATYSSILAWKIPWIEEPDKQQPIRLQRIRHNLAHKCSYMLHAGQEVTETDMDQQTGFKQGKEYIKAVYSHPAYLTYMQSTS